MALCHCIHLRVYPIWDWSINECITFARMQVCSASRGLVSHIDGGVNCTCGEHDCTVFLDLVVFIRVHCKHGPQHFISRVHFISLSFNGCLKVRSKNNRIHGQNPARSLTSVWHFIFVFCCFVLMLCMADCHSATLWPSNLVKPNIACHHVCKEDPTWFARAFLNDEYNQNLMISSDLASFSSLGGFQYLMHRSGRPAGGCSHCDSHSDGSPHCWYTCAGTADTQPRPPAAPPCWQPLLLHPWKKPLLGIHCQKLEEIQQQMRVDDRTVLKWDIAPGCLWNIISNTE